MQLLSSVSKLLLVVVCLSLLIVWDGNNIKQLDSTIDMASQNLSGTEATNYNNANVETSDSIWENMRREFTLDHKSQSAQVKAEIRILLADQAKLYHILNAAAPYIYFIHQQTRAKNLPGELALIPFVESEFNPNDHSSKGATGLWQLMSGTAHELGVKVKTGYDGRRNVVASTNAALAYFKDLGNNFNDNWYLAIAAYNCGQGKVQSVVRRTGNKNYWDLPLPTETKHYVPKLLAVAEIIQDPEKYGVQLPPVSNEPYFTEVKVNRSSVNLTQVAQSSGVSINTLHKLNPDYKQGSVKKSTTLLVPIDQMPAVKAQV